MRTVDIPSDNPSRKGGKSSPFVDMPGVAHPRKSAAPKAPPFGAKLLAPLGWCAKSIAWLVNSEKNGGAKFVLYGMSVYCFALVTETIYTTIPLSSSAQSAQVESIKFLPKPGIDDEAQFMRVVPPVGNVLKRIANGTIANVVPFYPRHELNPRWTVWSDPNFYIAFALSGLTGLIEARALRRTAKSWEKKQKKFQELNNRTIPDLNPNAVMAASLARAELATEGSGDYIMSSMIILATYGIEAFCFVSSIWTLDIGVLTTTVYAIVNVFGFEFCWAMAQDDEE